MKKLDAVYAKYRKLWFRFSPLVASIMVFFYTEIWLFMDKTILNPIYFIVAVSLYVVLCIILEIRWKRHNKRDLQTLIKSWEHE